MAAKRRASRRAARKEKSGEQTTVELIRVKKMYVKANTGSGARPFPEQWKEFSSNLVATFNDAQSAWDAYRKTSYRARILAFRKVGSHHASMQQYPTVPRSVCVVGHSSVISE
jgi:hypothetical protein